MYRFTGIAGGTSPTRGKTQVNLSLVLKAGKRKPEIKRE